MNSWINVKAVWEIVVIGLLAGAGLPAVFAAGVRALGLPGRGHVGGSGGQLAGASRAGKAVAALCFTIVLAAVGYGLYLIVATGHK
jgi:hypothetical protein